MMEGLIALLVVGLCVLGSMCVCLAIIASSNKHKVHQHSLNTQDHTRLNLTPQQRAAWKFCNVVALLSAEGEYYDLLPPAAQDIVTAAKLLAGKMGGQ